MKFEIAKYKKIERDPIGCFEAQMLASGWGQTRYVNNTSSILFSSELSEFIRFVDWFFRECSDWAKLNKYVTKNGTEIHGDDYSQTYAINYIGPVMDYTVQIAGTSLNVFPYRKFRH